MNATCDTCESALVLTDGTPPHNVDVVGTNAGLVDRVKRGRMRYLRGDVALEDMLALAQSEQRYTIVSFLECQDCGQVKFWGLCIRGAPIYKTVDAGAPEGWNWEPVPPREAWARYA